MSLQVWLPLNGELNNLGIAEAPPAATYTVNYSEGKIGAKAMNSGTVLKFTPSCFMKSTKYSLAFWVKSNVTTSTSTVWWKVCRLGYTDTTVHTVYTADSGRYKLEYNPEYNVYCDTTLWHHLVFLVDGAKITAYLNGALVGSATSNNTERILSYIELGGSTNVHLNDFRLYDHILSPKEIKEISQGLIVHYSLRDRYLESSNNLSTYPTPGSNVSTSYGWDSTLHPDAISVAGWSVGYNGGVEVPNTGYHAYWKLIDNIPTIVFPKRNSIINKPSRWLGISQSTGIQDKLSPNLTYTISVEARADTPNMTIALGLYYYITGGSRAFHDGCVEKTLSTEWQRISWTYTTGANIDTSQTAIVYIYGHHGSVEGTSYIRNIQIELNDHATPYTSSNYIGNNVIDCSGYNNTGIVTGKLAVVPTETGGRNTYCTKFNGSSYINCGRGAMVKDAITVTCWGYMDDWSKYSSSSYRLMSCTEGGGWNFEPSSNKINFACGTGVSANTYKSATATTTWASLAPGWHMFSGTYDGFTTKIYIDGILSGTNAGYTTKTPLYYNATNSIFLGAESTSSATTPTGNFFVGKLSDVRIYSTALSESDIADLYNNAVSIDNEQNIFAYEFNEAYNNKFDKTGTVNNFSFTNLADVYDMKITSLEDGSVWARIFWHDVTWDKKWFTNSAEVLECLNQNNRYSRMNLVDKYRSKKITLVNKLPAINGNTGFSAGTSSTAHLKYGNNTLMLTGNTSRVEVTAASTTKYSLDPTHIYYARVEVFQETVIGASDFYWPIAEPNMYSGKKAVAGKWTLLSTVNHRNSFTAGEYPFRLDFNNGSQDGNMWFDGVMLIDLTEAFGAGKEPTVEWCNTNIEYFEGTKTIDVSSLNNIGTYEFMLTYPNLSKSLYNRWTQTSSPNDSTVIDYSPITIAWPDHSGGIRRHGISYYNCDTGSTWYAALGQYSQWTDGKYIPAADGSSQTETELWVRIDTQSDKSIIELHKNQLAANDFIEI